MNVAAPFALPEPPHSVEAEQILLGGLLTDPSNLDALGGLPDNAFYDPAHRALFTAMRRRRAAGEAISAPALSELARTDDNLKALGGTRYLANLIAGSVGRPLDMTEVLIGLMDKRRLGAALTDGLSDLSREESKAGDVAAKIEAALTLAASGARSRPVTMLKAVNAALEAALATQRGDGPSGVASGIASLDRLLSPMRAGQMIILGGRPSMGKSAIGLSMALNAARSGKGVIVVSLEMTPEAFALRAISEATTNIPSSAISYRDIGDGRFTEHQKPVIAQAARAVSDLPVVFLPPDFRDVGAIAAGVRQARSASLAKIGVGLIVIDYVQLVQMAGSSRYEKVTEISIALKALAMQLGCPVLVLAQLSRAVEQRDDRRPMLSDLKESGQLEQDADAVIFCYRDEYYLEREEPEDIGSEDHAAWREAMKRSRNRLELIVAKQRQGAIGTARVGFNPALNAVWEFGGHHG